MKHQGIDVGELVRAFSRMRLVADDRDIEVVRNALEALTAPQPDNVSACDEVQAIKNALARRSKELDLARLELHEARSIVLRQSQDIAHLKGDRESLQVRLQSRIGERDRARARVAELEKERDEARAQLEALQRHHDELTAELRELRRRRDLDAQRIGSIIHGNACHMDAWGDENLNPHVVEMIKVYGELFEQARKWKHANVEQSGRIEELTAKAAHMCVSCQRELGFSEVVCTTSCGSQCVPCLARERDEARARVAELESQAGRDAAAITAALTGEDSQLWLPLSAHVSALIMRYLAVVGATER